MKFSVQEEYGLRFLIRFGKNFLEGGGLTIPEISESEAIAQHSVAKILRVLRLGGFLTSLRGHTGGYMLAQDPSNIQIGEVLNLLGGRLYDTNFCQSHTGLNDYCIHTTECATRPVWQLIQKSIDNVLEEMTLTDLLKPEDIIFLKYKPKAENSTKVKVV